MSDSYKKEMPFKSKLERKYQGNGKGKKATKSFVKSFVKKSEVTDIDSDFLYC